jgi:hypothetical protein
MIYCPEQLKRTFIAQLTGSRVAAVIEHPENTKSFVIPPISKGDLQCVNTFLITLELLQPKSEIALAVPTTKKVKK